MEKHMAVGKDDIGKWVRDSAGREGVLKRLTRWEDKAAPSWERRRSKEMAIIRPAQSGVERAVPVDEVTIVRTVPSSDGRLRRQ